MDMPQRLSGHVQGRFLKQMAAITGAKRVLEIGTFTGYSALCMAEGLGRSGKVITCDVNPAAIAIAKKYFALSEHGAKIEVKEGPALKTIESLKPEFDLAFIDADKENYKNYYEAILPLMRAGGVILVDNVLWSGAVLDPKTTADRAIVDFNQHVASDSRVETVLLTIRDGVMLIRKR
jgi:caffeoyl-CoA O-methyltransferase